MELSTFKVWGAKKVKDGGQVISNKTIKINPDNLIPDNLSLIT